MQGRVELRSWAHAPVTVMRIEIDNLKYTTRRPNKTILDLDAVVDRADSVFEAQAARITELERKLDAIFGLGKPQPWTLWEKIQK